MHRKQNIDLIPADTELERTLRSLRKIKKAENSTMADERQDQNEVHREAARRQDQEIFGLYSIISTSFMAPLPGIRQYSFGNCAINIMYMFWSSTDTHYQEAFTALKPYLSSPPILVSPSEGELFTLYLAVSDFATSAALVRERDRVQQPVYYCSRALRRGTQRWKS